MTPVRFDLSDPDAAGFCPSCGAGYALQATRCLDCDSLLVPRSEVEAEGRKSLRKVLALPKGISSIVLVCLGAVLIGTALGDLLVLAMGERIAVFPQPLLVRIVPAAYFFLCSVMERDLRLRVGWGIASFAFLLDSSKEEWQLGAWALYLALLGHVTYFRAGWTRVDTKWRRRAALVLILFFIFKWQTGTRMRGRDGNWWPPYYSVVSEEAP